jgi:putative membrane protein
VTKINDKSGGMLDKHMRTIWIAVYFIVLTWSAINPKDYYVWVLEVAPALIGFTVIAITYNRFRLTRLTYTLILIHCIILMIGGHYTYSEVPFFNWLRDFFELERNNYDKLGHFAQGFIPAIITREIILRKSIVRGVSWQNFLIVCVCLAISALYELMEWWVAILAKQSADAFLATQGYVWDTQSDMAWALIGAILSLVFLGKLHDKQLMIDRT